MSLKNEGVWGIEGSDTREGGDGDGRESRRDPLLSITQVWTCSPLSVLFQGWQTSPGHSPSFSPTATRKKGKNSAGYWLNLTPCFAFETCVPTLVCFCFNINSSERTFCWFLHLLREAKQLWGEKTSFFQVKNDEVSNLAGQRLLMKANTRQCQWKEVGMPLKKSPNFSPMASGWSVKCSCKEGPVESSFCSLNSRH